MKDGECGSVPREETSLPLPELPTQRVWSVGTNGPCKMISAFYFLILRHEMTSDITFYLAAAASENRLELLRCGEIAAIRTRGV